MRELTSHKVNGLDEALTIISDEPGSGNASHLYVVSYDIPNQTARGTVDIPFQRGPIQDVGVNGVSNEAVLAIVEDRLAGFQSGEYACRENALALTKIQEAMMWLQKRTRDRVARGVEGTNQK